MLVVFPLIFVADSKLIYSYNFVAPLKVVTDKTFQKAIVLIQQDCIKAEFTSIDKDEIAESVIDTMQTLNTFYSNFGSYLMKMA